MKRVCAFDLATRCGFAHGRANEKPVSGVWDLKAGGATNAAAGGELLRRLAILWAAAPPDLVVKEAPIYPARMRELENAWHSIAYTHGLHAVLEAMCELYKIQFTNVQASTWRKHFIGQTQIGRPGLSSMGLSSKKEIRRATKLAAVRRCHMLGHMPAHCDDVDQAEACGIWDYGVHAIAKSQTLAGRELTLFGGEPGA